MSLKGFQLRPILSRTGTNERRGELLCYLCIKPATQYPEANLFRNRHRVTSVIATGRHQLLYRVLVAPKRRAECRESLS
jgi:hypothetical protein